MKFHYTHLEDCHAETAFPLSDLEYCTQIDKFDFAMPITRQDGRLIMRCTKP